MQAGKPKYRELFDLSEAKLRQADELLAQAMFKPADEKRRLIEQSEALISEAEKLADIAKQVAEAR